MNSRCHVWGDSASSLRKEFAAGPEVGPDSQHADGSPKIDIALTTVHSEPDTGLEQVTEAELARRLIAGDSDGFELFVEHFRAKIFRYSWIMCGDREDAEEVAQETLLKVFENLGQLRTPERVRPWVFQIARRTCLMKRRRSVFAPDRELSLEDLRPGVEPEDGADRPDRRMLQSELAGVLDRAIRELPVNYRPVLLLRDVEELSTSDTARILDLSEDVVKTRLHRARLAVRKKLVEYGR